MDYMRTAPLLRTARRAEQACELIIKQGDLWNGGSGRYQDDQQQRKHARLQSTDRLRVPATGAGSKISNALSATCSYGQTNKPGCQTT